MSVELGNNGSDLAVLINTELMLLKGSGYLVMKLVQLIGRLQAAGRIDAASYDSLKKFVKDTDGDYTIANLPVAGEEKIREFTDSLRKAGIVHYILPDLDISDGLMQIAVRNKDLGKWQSFYERYVTAHLAGGKQSFEELKAVTAGNYEIKGLDIGDGLLTAESLADQVADLVNEEQRADRFIGQGKPEVGLPKELWGSREAVREQVQTTLLYQDPEALQTVRTFLSEVAGLPKEGTEDRIQRAEKALQGLENKDMKQLSLFLNCLEEKKVSYALLPDLRQGDGKTQIAVASSHLNRLTDALDEFIRLYKEQNGVDLRAHLINKKEMDEYLAMGKSSNKEYTSHLDNETQKAVDEVTRDIRKKVKPERTENFQNALDKQAQRYAGRSEGTGVEKSAERQRGRSRQRTERTSSVITFHSQRTAREIVPEIRKGSPQTIEEKLRVTATMAGDLEKAVTLTPEQKERYQTFYDLWLETKVPRSEIRGYQAEKMRGYMKIPETEEYTFSFMVDGGREDGLVSVFFTPEIPSHVFRLENGDMVEQKIAGQPTGRSLHHYVEKYYKENPGLSMAAEKTVEYGSPAAPDAVRTAAAVQLATPPLPKGGPVR